MERRVEESEAKYEIIIRRVGREEPVETNIMGDQEIREILEVIGIINLRSALAS